MKRALLLILSLALLEVAGLCQESPLNPDKPAGMTPQQIVERFTAKEKQFKEARKQCAYRQSVKFESLQGTTVTGEYSQVADVSLDASGKKVKNIVLAPVSSLTLSPEDSADIESRLYFTLSTDELPEYNVEYRGQQQEDDLHCYVFDVAPKKIEKDKRYFEGRIWVDDHDFQIVKMSGKSAPDILPKKKKQQPNLFPKFTTYRQIMDGRYWYPTYSLTDDTLHFPAADVRIRGTVKATEFRCAGAEMTQKKAEPGATTSSAKQ